MPHFFVAWAAFNAAQAAMLWPMAWMMLMPQTQALLQFNSLATKPAAKSPPKLTLVASNALPRLSTGRR